MTLPGFFVIGGQKCGTTTLYEDLRLQPQVALADKEGRTLCGPGVSPAELRDRYSSIFGCADPKAVHGEVSSFYSMLPDDPEIPVNASRVAPHAKVIYIVREPISRVISHHHHDFGFGFVGPDIDEAVHRYPPLIDNTRYATQIKPWIEIFGAEAVLVLKFERYIADRRSGLRGVLEFIGGSDADLIDPGTAAHNAAATKRIATGARRRIAQSSFYRTQVRPRLPVRLRRRINQMILTKAPPRPAPPARATLEYIADQMRPEVEELAALTGNEPFWDLNLAVSAHSARR